MSEGHRAEKFLLSVIAVCFVLTVLATERQSVTAAATHSLAQEQRTVTSFSFTRNINDREAIFSTQASMLGNFSALFLPFFFATSFLIASAIYSLRPSNHFIQADSNDLMGLFQTRI